VYGLSIYYKGFFGEYIDAQNALLFAFVPVFQWVGVVFVLGINFVIEKIKNTKK